VLLLVGTLLGCTPTSPEPSFPEASTPVVSTTPTPTWTDEEQAAIDAVQTYLSVWTEITQTLSTADLGQIRKVAGDPLANDDIVTWWRWHDNGWHLEGAPVFSADLVNPGPQDFQGERYYVHGCYILAGSYLAEVDNQPAPVAGTVERAVNTFTVLRLTDGSYLVTDNEAKDETC